MEKGHKMEKFIFKATINGEFSDMYFSSAKKAVASLTCSLQCKGCKEITVTTNGKWYVYVSGVQIVTNETIHATVEKMNLH
jgi:hypothetical protein